jgi:hypothetical protein
MKNKLNLLAIGFFMFSWLPTAWADEPSILELRVMQSRKYESTAKEFVLAVKEICLARGGSFVGIADYSSVHHEAKSNHFFETIGINCVRYRATNGGSNSILKFKIEGRSLDSKTLLVRMFADDMSRGVQITSSKIYELIFKDISEAIGLSDIPIQVNRAE